MEHYGIIGWIVIGGLAGAIAKLLMPGKDPGGCFITVLLGIAGALLAGWIGHAVGWYGENEGAGFIAAIIVRQPTRQRIRCRADPVVALPGGRGPPTGLNEAFSKQPWPGGNR